MDGDASCNGEFPASSLDPTFEEYRPSEWHGSSVPGSATCSKNAERHTRGFYHPMAWGVVPFSSMTQFFKVSFNHRKVGRPSLPYWHKMIASLFGSLAVALVPQPLSRIVLALGRLVTVTRSRYVYCFSDTSMHCFKLGDEETTLGPTMFTEGQTH